MHLLLNVFTLFLKTQIISKFLQLTNLLNEYLEILQMKNMYAVAHAIFLCLIHGDGKIYPSHKPIFLLFYVIWMNRPIIYILKKLLFKIPRNVKKKKRISE